MPRTAIIRRSAVVLLAVLALPACGSAQPGVSPDTTTQGAVSQDAVRGNLVGVGNDSMAGLVSSWREAWKNTNPAVSIAFSPDGGETGVKALAAGQAHFATTTRPAGASTFQSNGEVCGVTGRMALPAAILPVGIAYNLREIRGLKLDAVVLSKVFLGSITKWNDPEIGRLNPDINLPDIDIVPILSSDESDVTEAATRYLDAESKGTWPAGISSRWPDQAKGQNKSKSSDLTGKLGDTYGGLAVLDRGIIGSRFSTAILKFGQTFQPFSPDSVLAAIESGSTVQPETGILEQQLNGDAGYALAVKEYVVLCDNYRQEETAKLVRSWGRAILSDVGQRNANIFASALPPSRETTKQALLLVNTIAGTEK
jgi:phosphate transport system substrate-binding protein